MAIHNVGDYLMKENFGGRIYYVSEFIMRLAWIQILWIFFSIIGLGLFGVLPATVALFSVIRKWQMNNDVNFKLFKFYWMSFRKEFFKANLLGLILFIIGYLLYINYSLVRMTDSSFTLYLLIGLFILNILFLVLLIHIFPIYVHYDLKVVQYLSLSLLIGISFPIHTFVTALGLYGFYRLFLLIPGLIPFFSMSSPAFFIIWLSLHVFKKFEKKMDGTMAAKSKHESSHY